MILTPNQIGVMMTVVGWTGDASLYEQAIAITHGESGWNPAKVNKIVVDGKHAVGLWQIMTDVNDKNANQAMLDLNQNMNTAFNMYRDRGWSPWDAYNNKSPQYRAGLGHGKEVAAYLASRTPDQITAESVQITRSYVGPSYDNGGGGTGVGSLGSSHNYAADAAGKLTGWVGELTAWVSAQAVGVGVFLLGVILFVLGLWLLAGKPGGDLAKRLPGV